MTTYTIGIVGAGGMGKGIIRRLTAAGQTVLVTDHSAENAERAAAESSAHQSSQARAATLDEILSADIVIPAIPYPGTVTFATANREALTGKIVIDIANPLDGAYTGLTLSPTTSAAEELARAILASRVVKAFNTIPALTLFPADVDGVAPDVFVASDDEHAKAVVMALLEGSALRPLDAGALANARLLERLTAFGIELGQRYGIGFDFGLKYLPTRPLTNGKLGAHE